MNSAPLPRSVACWTAVVSAILLMPGGNRLYAQTRTWDGAANDYWSNDAADVNWSGSPWSASANAVFVPGTYWLTLTDSIVANNILLANTLTEGVTLNLAGSRHLTVTGNTDLELGPGRTEITTGIGPTVVDMAELDEFTFNASSRILRVGLRSGIRGTETTSTTVSTVTLAQTNTITASQLLVADRTGDGGGGQSFLYLGGANTINASTIAVAAGGRSTGTLAFDAELTDPSATFRGTGGGSTRVTTWNVGRVANYTNNTWTATVDFSGGGIDALVGAMTLGDANSGTSSNRAGTVNASFTMGAGTMDVTTLNIGRVTGGGSLSGGFNGNGTFSVSGADAQFTAGTVHLATMDHTATGGSPSTSGLFHLVDGSAIISGSIVLGSNTKGGDANSGAVHATLWQDAGTLSIAGGLLEGSSAGGTVSSNVRLLGGTSTITGGLSTDTMRVGVDGRTAHATVASGSVRIGDGTGTGLIVGHRTDTTLTTAGILNLAAAGGVAIDTATVEVALNDSTIESGIGVAGTLTLSAAGANTVTANLLRLGHIGGGSTGGTAGTLNLGLDNTINVDTFVVGGNKAMGTVAIAAGGTLTLRGKAGGISDPVDLLIGANNGGNTGTNPAESHFNLAGGAVDAALGNVVIGQYAGTGAGSGKGRFTMSDGMVTANGVLLADSNGSNAGNTQGTLNIAGGSFNVAGNILGGSGQAAINLTGGTLSAQAIIPGTGTTAFHWADGTLHAGSFGSAGSPFHLTQNGGTLAPGTSVGATVVYGNYAMNAGELEIEIAGPADHDCVMVHGDAMLSGNLNVLLLDGFFPTLGTYFDVLQTTGNLDFSGLALTGDLPSAGFGWWNLGAVASGDGFLLRLSAVPEPSSAVLMLMGLALLLGARRCRR